ncbi:MAG TPA: hypothetical protein VKE94_12595 [Gemmataceae bacterium]|nr:hypothetical protein [Gemmataceae bacterium]
MPEIIYCPECERTVSVPERLFGKLVRCPSCRHTFRAEAPATEEPEVVDEEPARPAGRKPSKSDRREEDAGPLQRKRRGEDEEKVEAPSRRPRRKAGDEDEVEEGPRRKRREEEEQDEEDEEDRPRRRPKRPRLSVDDKAAWRRVRFGLTFVLAGAAVGLLANIGGVIGMRSVDPPTVRGSFSTGLIVTWILYYAACTAAAALTIAGNVYCMVIPNERNARSTLTSSVAMICLGLFLLLGALFYQYVRLKFWEHAVTSSADANPSSPPLEGLVIYIFGATLLLAQPTVFTLFLRSAAKGVRADGLALSMIFQAIVPAVVALCFVISSMNVYSALKGAIDTSTTYDVDWDRLLEKETAWNALGILCFVQIAYAVWYIVSLVLTRIAIIRLVDSPRY